MLMHYLLDIDVVVAQSSLVMHVVAWFEHDKSLWLC